MSGATAKRATAARRAARRGARIGAALAAAIALAAPSARAQGKDQLDRAKALFNAGAQLYTSGQFAAAIDAFEQANKIVSRPSILFSLAQAHKRQYFIDKNPEHLRVAIRNYRSYVDQVPEGGRRADAAQALAELVPLEEKLGAEAPAPARPAARPVARLLVTSPTPGAMVTLDDKVTKPVPFGPEVSPGRHKVRVFAPGYADEEQVVEAVEGNVVVPVSLRERPARLVIRALANAQVSIDGRFAGTTPLSSPIEMAAGDHLVVVTRTGYRPVTEELKLGRDERRTLDVRLEVTGQRVVANALLVSGAALAVVGGAFGAVALVEQGRAASIRDEPGSRVTPSDLDDYEGARRARDRWTTASLVTLSAAGASLATGLLFRVFDQPTVASPPQRFDEHPPSPQPAPPSGEPSDLLMGVAPSIAPTFAGAAVVGRF